MNLQHNFKGRYKAIYQPDVRDVYQLIKRIADVQGKDFTPSNPILDTELSFIRVNAVHDSYGLYIRFSMGIINKYSKISVCANYTQFECA